MYLRDTEFSTLEDVYAASHDRRSTWRGSSTDVVVDLTDESVIRLGKKTIPASPEGLHALAQFYEVPSKFLERLLPDEQQFILDHRIQRTEDRPMAIKYSKTGITEAYQDNVVRLGVESLIECLLDVLPAESPVIEWHNDPGSFMLDAIVPEGFDRGIGGDSKVGDITRGGVRIGQDRKRNLAPWTQTFLYRLRCTNGMEIPDLGIKIDTRGVDEESILAMFRAETRRAFDRAEKDIERFYHLRTIKADDDYTGLFRRMTQDLGLPDRTIGNMENTLADELEEGEEVTMFHLVNHVTNQAIDPNIHHQYNVRRRLERAGGHMVSDHASRCPSCHSRLN